MNLKKIDWFRVALIAVLAAAFLSLATVASATDVSLTPPTKNTDGTDIPADGPNALAHHVIQMGDCTPWATLETWIMLMPNTSMTIPTPGVGTWCFRAAAQNNSGEQSDWTNPVFFTVDPAVPGVPGNLTITLGSGTP